MAHETTKNKIPKNKKVQKNGRIPKDKRAPKNGRERGSRDRRESGSERKLQHEKRSESERRSENERISKNGRKTENKKTRRTKARIKRTFKARIFEMVFRNRKELLQLYNAVNGTDYRNPELLEINTLENAVYMSMHNDLSFIIDLRLNLYEHQSTYNPNLPLRDLMYVSDLYSEITKNANLYGTRLIRIPTPRFIVFYNGTEPRPDCETLKLSDAFTIREDKVSLELEVTVLNINPGHNEELLNACRTLRDYSEYTARVRRYARDMKLEDAVELAITECIREGVLAEFLSRNRAEAVKVSIYEYNEEEHMRQEREASWEDGREEGRREGREEGREEGRREEREEEREKMTRLIVVLLNAGRQQDLLRACGDRNYMRKMLREFQLDS